MFPKWIISYLSTCSPDLKCHFAINSYVKYVSFSLYCLFLYKRICLLNYSLCHVLVMWKGNPLVLPFQNLLSSVYFLFSDEIYNQSVQLRQVKPLQELLLPKTE